MDVLEFYTEQTKREAEEYGESNLRGAVERMSDDRWAALVREAKSSPSTPIPTPHRPAPAPPQQQQQQQQQKRPDQDVNEMMEDLSVKTNGPKLSPPRSPNPSDRMPPVSQKESSFFVLCLNLLVMIEWRLLSTIPSRCQPSQTRLPRTFSFSRHIQPKGSCPSKQYFHLWFLLLWSWKATATTTWTGIPWAGTGSPWTWTWKRTTARKGTGKGTRTTKGTGTGKGRGTSLHQEEGRTTYQHYDRSSNHGKTT